MKDTKLDGKKLIPVIVVLVVVFLMIGFQYLEQRDQEPTLHSLENGTVTIGVICPQTSELDAYTYLAELAQEDINQHLREQGKPQEFNFIVSDAQGHSMNAYEIAKQNYDAGNKLIVGLSWSSQMDMFCSFAKENGCLIISPGSTQPWPWRLAPSTYRLYPADHLYTFPMVEAIESINITKVIILQLDTGFADIMKEEFAGEYSGEITEILIEAQSSDTDLEQATNVLKDEIQNSIKVHGVDHVAVYYVGFSDHLEKMLNSATDDTFFSIPWFVWNWYNWNEGSGTKYSGFEEESELLARIKLIGTHPATPDNPVFTRINDAYIERFGEPISMIHGNVYDGLWLTALSVVEAQSIDGSKVGEKIPDVAKKHLGVTGNCSFNDWGDRWGIDWTLWGYELEGDRGIVTQFGLFNCSTGEITWYIN